MIGWEGYLELCKRVREVDDEAAEYMLNVAYRLDSFTPSDTLGCSFLWSATPQGHDYWSDISDDL